jgi:hypothetical protein
MTNSIHYNDNIIAFPTRPKTEWFVDLGDTSITIDHASTGLSFRFQRDGALASLTNDIDISGNEDHPKFQEILDEAAQIAEGYAEEWNNIENEA